MSLLSFTVVLVSLYFHTPDFPDRLQNFLYSLYLFVIFRKSGADAPINQPGDVATTQGVRGGKTDKLCLPPVLEVHYYHL